MFIQFTADAINKIQSIMNQNKATGKLKLAYDTDGCGCAVNGVAALWLVDVPESNDTVHACDPFEVWIDRKQEVFFEESMTIDYKAEGVRFILRSNSQTYNAHMSLVDKRAVSV